MTNSRMQLVVLGLAAALVAAATVVQGRWTERWVPISRDQVIEAARLLESRFPGRFGEWEMERELDSDPKELAAAGAMGHISRVYRNTRTKSRISVFVVCALPYDASAHTPDRCYPGAGFTVGESEHRVKLPAEGDRQAEALTGTFVKSGQTLRIFWTYGVARTGRIDWVAPQLPRIALSGEPSVYKLYVIADQTRIGASQSMLECESLICQLAPALDAVLAGGDPAAPETSTAESAAAPPLRPASARAAVRG
jgi:hypothetical protein